MGRGLLGFMAGVQLYLLAAIVWMKDNAIIGAQGDVLEGQGVILSASVCLFLCSIAVSIGFRRRHLIAAWVSFGTQLASMLALLSSIPAIAHSRDEIGVTVPVVWSVVVVGFTIAVDVLVGAFAAFLHRSGRSTGEPRSGRS